MLQLLLSFDAILILTLLDLISVSILSTLAGEALIVIGYNKVDIVAKLLLVSELFFAAKELALLLLLLLVLRLQLGLCHVHHD